MLKSKTDIVIERVNKDLCPVCKESLEQGKVVFVRYKDNLQPVHKRHIRDK